MVLAALAGAPAGDAAAPLALLHGASGRLWWSDNGSCDLGVLRLPSLALQRPAGEQLSDEPVTAEKHARIVSFANSIAEQEIELLNGVAETLPLLASRHRCVLVTKGDPEEQTHKLTRSGLEQHFTAVEVLPEKHELAYRSLSDHHGCEAARTWMIGNSPRSDINPALAAGLHAIFIPHDFTWVLEHEPINSAPTGQHLLELATFPDLLTLF